MIKVNYVNDSGSIGGGPVNVEAARDYPNTVIVTMSPDEFLTLTSPILDSKTEFMKQAIQEGKPIAMPFLGVDIFDKDKKELVVDDHEGRHRVLAMKELGINSIKVILVGRCLERNPEIKQNIKSYTLYPQNYGNEWQHSDKKFQINEDVNNFISQEEFENWIKGAYWGDRIFYRGQDTEYDFEWDGRKNSNFVNFAFDKNTASMFGSNIEEFYLNCKKPFDFNKKEDFDRLLKSVGEINNIDTMHEESDPIVLHSYEEYKNLNNKMYDFGNNWEFSEKYTFEIMDLGYDSLVMTEGGDKTVMTFNKNQIHKVSDIMDDEMINESIENKSTQTELIDFSNMTDAEYEGFNDAWSRSYSSYYEGEEREEYDRGYDLCVSKGWEHVGSDFEYAHHKEIYGKMYYYDSSLENNRGIYDVYFCVDIGNVDDPSLANPDYIEKYAETEVQIEKDGELIFHTDLNINEFDKLINNELTDDNDDPIIFADDIIYESRGGETKLVNFAKEIVKEYKQRLSNKKVNESVEIDLDGEPLEEREMEFHDELNPKLWNSDNTLKPEVKEKLMDTAIIWADSIDMPWVVKDVRIDGSSANYNYRDDSDIDLHLVFDYDEIGMDKEFLKFYLFSKMSNFNKAHNISIYGIPVECGFESLNDESKSSGVYSLLQNKWLKEPTIITQSVEDVSDTEDYEELKSFVEINISKPNNSKKVAKILNDLRELRKKSLELDGEFGKGNLLYKQLRSDGLLDAIKDYLVDDIDRRLSLK